MDGLNQLTAAEGTIRIGEQTFRLGQLTLADYGEIENRVVSRRRDPVSLAVGNLDGLGEKQQEFLLGRAFDEAAGGKVAGAREIDRWRQTPDGYCYLFWMMVRKGHPEVTLQRAGQLLASLTIEIERELRGRMEDALGMPAGNSPGQTQPATIT